MASWEITIRHHSNMNELSYLGRLALNMLLLVVISGDVFAADQESSELAQAEGFSDYYECRPFYRQDYHGTSYERDSRMRTFFPQVVDRPAGFYEYYNGAYEKSVAGKFLKIEQTGSKYQDLKITHRFGPNIVASSLPTDFGSAKIHRFFVLACSDECLFTDVSVRPGAPTGATSGRCYPIPR